MMLSHLWFLVSQLGEEVYVCDCLTTKGVTYGNACAEQKAVGCVLNLLF